jgi:3-hydroxyisobutyrate dehydrogenase-like beta-hydroxyacid dehydrogenase
MRLIIPSLILAINQIALAEGLALGRSLGIDPVLLHNVVNTSSGTSFLLSLRFARHAYLELESIWNRNPSGTSLLLELLYFVNKR